jgi:glycerol-3-phosphate acyltransferase PlsY
MNLLLVVLSYLLGSLTFGIIVSRVHGRDIRDRDLPGGSGVYRQMGLTWALLVVLLDILKGASAAYLAAFGTTLGLLPLCAAAVVAGHSWPVLFGFRGGGGIAPSVGVLLYAYPQPSLLAVLFGFIMMALYHTLYWRHKGGIYPLPFGTMLGYLMLLYLLRADPAGFWTALAVVIIMALRGVQILGPKRSSTTP